MPKLSTKGWISAFNAQGSRGIIVAVQVGAVKIYLAAVEALRKKETPLNVNVLFWRFFFFQSHPVYDQTQGTGAVFSWLSGYLYYTLEIRFFWNTRNCLFF